MKKHRIILFISGVMFFIGCNSSKMIKENNGSFDKAIVTKFDYQGHRGCRGLRPENTISAMLHAIDLGVTTLETDVVITKDNVVLLSHEPFFNHEITTKPNGSFIDVGEEKNYNIYKMTFAETQQYDVGLKVHSKFKNQLKLAANKPSLANMIDSAENYIAKNNLPKISYNIETKTTPATDKLYHPAPAPFVDMLMKVIVAKKIEDRVTVQSFDRRTLQYLHKKYPAIKTALLVEALDRNSFRKQIKDLGFTPTIYSPNKALVNANLVTECHKKNIQIIPWTVNDAKEIATLKKLGVDGIISDYPNLFKL